MNAPPKNCLIQEKITSEFYQSRVDVWVRHKWPHIPYASIQKAIRKGLIKVNGNKTQPFSRLDPSSILFYKENWPCFFHAPQKDRTISDGWKKKVQTWILHEDDHMIVLNKPFGIACQGGSGQLFHVDGLMQAWCKGRKIRLVHRLDKQTSGVLVLAKTLNCARDLSHAFHDHQIKKVYWALVHGHLSPKGMIDTPIERKGRIMVPSQSASAQKCLTRYACRGKSRDQSWAEIYPLTGRMHQIRAHMASIGHPVQGDHLYGIDRDDQKGPLFLHCRKMSWTMKGQKYSFVAACPEHFYKNGYVFESI